MLTKRWFDCHSVNAVCYVPNCKETFTCFGTFVSHLKEEHFNDETGNEWRVCDYDGCGFKPKNTSSDYFLQHLHTHYGNLDIFCCNFCSYKCCTKPHLKRHLKIKHKIIASIREPVE